MYSATGCTNKKFRINTLRKGETRRWIISCCDLITLRRQLSKQRMTADCEIYSETDN